MEIKQYSQLDNHLIEQIEKLEADVHAHDGTFRDIYLDNRFNFDQSMPYVLLAWEDEQLLACLHIYADNREDVEISIIVHPDYRRQGIASTLIHFALELTDRYNIQEVTFVSEQSFLDKSDYWKANYHWSNDEIEYLMVADVVEGQETQNTGKNIRKATQEDVITIAHLQAQAFDSPFVESLNYTEGAMADDTHILYVFENADQKILGSTSINISPDYYYFFGLAVAADFQGQGVATSAIQQVMSDLAQQKNLPYRLAVEDDNSIAVHVYEKNGFKKLTEVIYMKEQKNK